MVRRAFLCSVAFVLWWTVAGESYYNNGPCKASSSQGSLSMPNATGCGSQCRVDAFVTFPIELPASYSTPPVVIFFNGFKASAAYYKQYVSHLVSWGYAVVQYDTSLLSMVPDEVELGFLEHLLDWLRTLDIPCDPSNVAVVGHSRGAKLAALHLAGHSNISSAYLIDPVDSSTWTKGKPGYPSAVDALKGKDKIVAISGAGILGACNGEGDYRHFFDVVGPGSWLSVVRQAGHAQFLEAGPLLDWTLDRLCGCGNNTHVGTIELTRPFVTAWLEKTLKGKEVRLERGEDGRPQATGDCFFHWVQQQVENGTMTFTTKQSNGKLQPGANQAAAVMAHSDSIQIVAVR